MVFEENPQNGNKNIGTEFTELCSGNVQEIFEENTLHKLNYSTDSGLS